MKKFALIGYPLSHSLSPIIHKELFKISNVNATYELLEITPDKLSLSKDELMKYNGFNVTIPHKMNIIPLCDNLSERASLYGAVNTVKNNDLSFTGHNTDCFGFLNSIRNENFNFANKKVLVLGNGGVSRMFAFESVLGGNDVTISARNTEKSKLLLNEIKEKINCDVKYCKFEDVNGGYDIIINGTPIGMSPKIDVSPLNINQIEDCSFIFDAIYNPSETLLLSYARKSNIKYLNGLSMLVWQAAIAQEIWSGTKFSNDMVQKVIEITKRESGII